jgi:hypothetical protein
LYSEDSNAAPEIDAPEDWRTLVGTHEGVQWSCYENDWNGVSWERIELVKADFRDKYAHYQAITSKPEREWTEEDQEFIEDFLVVYELQSLPTQLKIVERNININLNSHHDDTPQGGNVEFSFSKR